MVFLYPSENDDSHHMGKRNTAEYFLHYSVNKYLQVVLSKTYYNKHWAKSKSPYI